MPSIKKFSMILNNIEAIIENPCAPSWDVVVSTAVPAAKDVIIFLITPSLVDILQNWAHPKFGRNRSRGRRPRYWERQETRRGEKRVAQRFGLPDLDEIIAEKIPGRKFFGSRVAGNKESWAWFGLDILDRLQWYWLIASLTEEFIYDWTSGIVQSNFCSKKFNAIAQFKVNPGTYADTNLILHGGLTYANGMIVSQGSLQQTTGRSMSLNVTAGCEWHNVDPFRSRNIELRITALQKAGGKIVEEQIITMPPNGDGKISLTLQGKDIDQVQFVQLGTGGIQQQLLNGYISCFGYVE